ncbi:MAG: hypothetical protein ACT4PU_04840 [Planctomycetota bacterium]
MNLPLRLASTGLGLMLLASAPRAQVEVAYYVNADLFAFDISQMPDLDQRRDEAQGIAGLPGNGGMYCAPTSAMNMMMYAANHGLPFIAPGPGNYQLQSAYNLCTQKLLDMGQFMETHPTEGTDGAGFFYGIKDWLGQSAPGLFTVTSGGAQGNYSPTLKDLAKAAIHGSLVSLAYGRYQVIGFWGQIPVVDRDGGHVVTLGRASALGGALSAGLRDPANPDDGMLTTQSWFGNREVTVENRVVATEMSLSALKVMSAIDYDPLKEKNAYIDGYVAFKPKFGLTWAPDAPSKTTVLGTLAVAGFVGSQAPSQQTITIEGLVLDAIVGPDQTTILAIVSPKAGGSIELVEVDLLDSGNKKFIAVPNANSIHTSRSRRVYVAAPNAITVFDLGDELVETTAIPPFPVAGICFDDATDELILLGSDAKQLARWKDGLGASPTVINLPSTLTMGGKSTIALDPTTGDILFATEKSPSMIRVRDSDTPNPTVTVIDLPGLPFPDTLDVDDIGHLFAVASGRVHELALDGQGDWKAVEGAPFDNWPAHAAFRVTKSRTNHDPATMSGPKFRNLAESELTGLVDGPFVPDCESEPSNLEYGLGKPGAFGVPRLAALDLPTLGLGSSIQLTNGLPGAMPVLLLSTQSAELPFDAGTLHVVPQFVFWLNVPIPADGTLTLPGTLPEDPAFCGFTLYHQMLFVDPAAAGPKHTAQSNGLARTFGS